MTHVEGTGNIRRGDDKGIDVSVKIWGRTEILLRYPV
jgi:hypothetical protein